MAEDDKMVPNSIEATPHAVATGRLELHTAFKPPFHFDGSTLVEDRETGSNNESARQDLDFIDSQITAINASFSKLESRLRTSPDTSFNAVIIALAPNARKIINLQTYLTTHLESSFADHSGVANRVLGHLESVSKKMDAFYDEQMARDAEKAKPSQPKERKHVMRPFERRFRTAIAAAMIAMPSLNFFRDIRDVPTSDQAVSQFSSDNLADIIDIPGYLMNPGELAVDPDKQPIQTPPESVSEQEIGIVYELLDLPTLGNVRASATASSEAIFDFEAVRTFNRLNPEDALVIQLTGVTDGQEAFGDGNVRWFRARIVGANPGTLVPEPFSSEGYIFSGVFPDDVREAATSTLTATPGTPGTPQPAGTETQVPEQIPPMVPAPEPPTTGTERPASGDPPPTGTDPAPGGDTPQPEGQPDGQPVIEPTLEILSPEMGVPGAFDGQEVVDAANPALRAWVEERTDASILTNPDWHYNPSLLAYERTDENGVVYRYRPEMGTTPEQNTMRETWRFTSDGTSGAPWTIAIEMNGLHPEGVVVTPPEFSDPENRRIFQQLWEQWYPFLRQGGTYVFSISDQYAGTQPPEGTSINIVVLNHLGYKFQRSGNATIIRAAVGINEGLDYGTAVAIMTAFHDIKLGLSEAGQIPTFQNPAFLNLFNETALALQETEGTNLGYVIPFPEQSIN